VLLVVSLALVLTDVIRVLLVLTTQQMVWPYVFFVRLVHTQLRLMPTPSARMLLQVIIRKLLGKLKRWNAPWALTMKTMVNPFALIVPWVHTLQLRLRLNVYLVLLAHMRQTLALQTV
jgi:hypothetical protein